MRHKTNPLVIRGLFFLNITQAIKHRDRKKKKKFLNTVCVYLVPQSRNEMRAGRGEGKGGGKVRVVVCSAST